MHKAPKALITKPPPQDITINPPRDPCTLSNYNNFRTKHTAVDFRIDFDKQSLSGESTLTLESKTEGETGLVVLDTSHLDIRHVHVQGKPAGWSLGPEVAPYGRPLSVRLEQPVKKGGIVDLKISLSTTKDCTALQWLTPGQTSNGKWPYMFSQCQPIHARSLFPCQDTPDIKSTFSFRLRSPLQVLASGLPQGTEKLDGSTESTYLFKQDVPIPTYLFAIASGDLVSAPIGPRSKVWTGPPDLDAARWELEENTEKYIAFVERLIYPYVWGTYDVLVLPPSFPYGGMENPQYTFLTPTTISGDRQNVDVVAHELCHSWSGNLVSLASWEHPWLNEGWTTYLERRIAAHLHGEAARDFSAIIGWKALQDSVDHLGADHEYTKLIVDLKGKDPDDAFSSVQYEKGATFLLFLEKLVGKEAWNGLVVHYFTKWKFLSLDSYDFKSTLLDYFSTHKDTAISKRLETLDWDAWFYSPGLPPKPDFDTSLADACYALASKWAAFSSSPSTSPFTPSAKDIASFTSSQTLVFLERVQQFDPPLSASASRKMGETYSLLHTSNVELSSRYYDIGMKAGDKEVLGPVTELLGKVGRMKFVRPLYRQLMAVERGLAKETFERNKEFYHPICRRMVEKLFEETAGEGKGEVLSV